MDYCNIGNTCANRIKQLNRRNEFEVESNASYFINTFDHDCGISIRNSVRHSDDYVHDNIGTVIDVMHCFLMSIPGNIIMSIVSKTKFAMRIEVFKCQLNRFASSIRRVQYALNAIH